MLLNHPSGELLRRGHWPRSHRLRRPTQRCLWAFLAACVLLWSGCARAPWAKSEEGGVVLAGSTSIQPFAERWAEAYHGGRVTVQAGGSTAGIKAAHDGTAHFGMSSRELHPEESAGIVQTVVARDGIAVIVHARNPVREMTLAQLRAIYAGEIRSWSELGGDDLPITVITREEGSGTRDTFQERVMGSAAQISPTALVTAYSGGLRKMVAEDPRVIGYVTFRQINDQVRAVAVDGVMPTDATITSGRYLLQRPFLLLSRGAPTGEADDFLRFILSTEGQAMARADGLAPVEVH